MRLRKFIFITSILLGAIQSATAQNQLVTYPAPKGAELMNDFTVKVREAGKDWKSIDTYLVKVDEVRKTQHNVENASMSYFDFSGEVLVAQFFASSKLFFRVAFSTSLSDSRPSRNLRK